MNLSKKLNLSKNSAQIFQAQMFSMLYSKIISKRNNTNETPSAKERQNDRISACFMRQA